MDSNNEEHEPARSNNTRKFKKDDYVCNGQILSALSDKLFDLYCESEWARVAGNIRQQIWQGAGDEKYTGREYFYYKMVEDKSVSSAST